MRAVVFALSLAACEPPPADGPNLLLVVLDDIGPEKTSVYGDPGAPPTPNLEALAAEGIRFDRAYADPVCSPTRAGLLTGRHAFHYGIGTYLTTRSGWWLPEAEVTLAEALVGYETAAIGKFHVGGPKDGPPNGSFALDQGFGHYEGAPDNLQGGVLSDGLREDYFHYERLDGDAWSIVDDYATVDVTDAALRAVDTLREPWFVHVGYHGAHAPWHAPPDDLDPLGVEAGDPAPVLFDGMVASLDQEIGRLLDGLDADLRARTLIVVIGDNGTPGQVKTGDHEGLPGKETVYEGGTRVPLIVAGGHVGQVGTIDALVSHVDVFATLLAASGVPAEVPSDSVSFLPLLDDPLAPSPRDHVYAEVFLPRGPGPHTERYDRMVRGERFKLVRLLDQPDQLFDLDADPLERNDLLAAPLDTDAEAARAALADLMNAYTLLAP